MILLEYLFSDIFTLLQQQTSESSGSGLKPL